MADYFVGLGRGHFEHRFLATSFRKNDVVNQCLGFGQKGQLPCVIVFFGSILMLDNRPLGKKELIVFRRSVPLS